MRDHPHPHLPIPHNNCTQLYNEFSITITAESNLHNRFSVGDDKKTTPNEK